MRFSRADIEILAALGQGLTLAAIAEQLHIGPPAVSKALRELERKCRLDIVDHGPNRLRLTPTGQELSALAQELIQRVGAFEQFVESVEAGNAGPIRLLAVSTPGNYVLPEVISEFYREHPRAKVELTIVPGVEAWMTFASGDYDLAVGQLWIGARPPEFATWRTEVLYQDTLVLFVGWNSPLAQQDEVSWSTLRSERFVTTFTEPYWTRLCELLALDPAYVGELVTLEGHEAIKRLVASGTGVGVLYRSAVWRQLHRGALHALHVPLFDRPFTYHIVSRAHRRPSIVDRFHDFLLNRVPPMVAAYADAGLTSESPAQS